MKTLEDRFWEKVVKTEACWLWTSAIGTGGYGSFSATSIGLSRSEPAHRVSWTLQNGPIPEGLYVLHTCDNRLCVRPSHLFLGTHATNMQDKIAKGRQSKGAAHSVTCRGTLVGNSKLTEAIVIAIRQDTRPQAIIGMEYGITQALVSYVKSGKIWKHVK